MAREHFTKSIRDGNGVLRQNVTVRLLEPGVDTLISEEIYISDTGEDTYTNPRTLEVGALDFYLDKPRIVDIGITPAESSTETVLRNQWVGDEEAYRETLSFTLAGNVTAQTGSLRFYVDDDCVIERVRVSVGVAPTGGDLVIDVNRNGSTLFTTPANRPKVLAGTNVGTAVPDVTALEADDYLTIDVDAVGSAAEMVVQIRIRRVT